MAYEARSFAGSAVDTQLDGGIDSAVLSLLLNDTTGWTGLTGRFVLAIDPDGPNFEKLLCSGIVGSTVTVVSRAYDGTAAVAHEDNEDVRFIFDAVAAQESHDAARISVGQISGIGQILVGSGTNNLGRVDVSGTDGLPLREDSGDPLGMGFGTIPQAAVTNLETRLTAMDIEDATHLSAINDLGTQIDATDATVAALATTVGNLQKQAVVRLTTGTIAHTTAVSKTWDWMDDNAAFTIFNDIPVTVGDGYIDLPSAGGGASAHVYRVTVRCLWAGDSGGYRALSLKINGTTYAQDLRATGVGNSFPMECSALVDTYLDGTQITVTSLQTSGGALTIAASPLTCIEIERRD